MTFDNSSVAGVIEYMEEVTTVTDIAATETSDPGVNIVFSEELVSGYIPTSPIASVYYHLPDEDNRFPVITVSSMDGCPLNCVPCDADRIRFKHTAEQMLFQVYKAHQAAGIGKKPFVVSLTGSGEPMYNVQEVLKFISHLKMQYPEM